MDEGHPQTVVHYAGFVEHPRMHGYPAKTTEAGQLELGREAEAEVPHLTCAFLVRERTVSPTNCSQVKSHTTHRVHQSRVEEVAAVVQRGQVVTLEQASHAAGRYSGRGHIHRHHQKPEEQQEAEAEVPWECPQKAYS